MTQQLYDSNSSGEVVSRHTAIPAQFCTARHYDLTYREERPRFSGMTTPIYALPFAETPVLRYLGPGRGGLNLFDDLHPDLTAAQRQEAESWQRDCTDFRLSSFVEAEAFLLRYRARDEYDVLFLRQQGSSEKPPAAWRLLGYDVCYPPEADGAFSIICDCMFLCKWHGCDEKGALFLEDFVRLNENGLFDRAEDAEAYMRKYLAEDWAEHGVFGIFEVYAR